MTKNWVPHDVRDQVVDFVRRWAEKAEIRVGRFPQRRAVVRTMEMVETRQAQLQQSQSTTIN